MRAIAGHSALALMASLALLSPAPASAVSYVKSVEYVELNSPPTASSVSVNLTKGQTLANCVPFAAAIVSGTDANYQRVFTDVLFETGPDRVTVRRADGTGFFSVGVFVVEFDPAFVTVRQGTFAIANGVPSATLAIPSVDLTKTALVSYYRWGPAAANWANFALAGWFSAANQLSWQRNLTNGPLDGHYYVFEAKNNEFSVQPVTFNVGNSAASGTAAISTVDADKTFLIASYRTAYAGDDNEDGQIAVFLSSPTQITARRQFQNTAPNAITEIRAFVVRLSGDVHVQHGSITYADSDAQKTLAIQPVNLDATMVWGGVSLGPGAIESEATTAVEGDTGFQRLKLLNATTLQGDRGESCPGTDCGGIGQYEVVDFGPPGGMQVKSGVYTGDGVDGRAMSVGFQPDVVFVKRDGAFQGVVRTSTMLGDSTKDLAAAGAPLAADLVQSLTPGGFTVGLDARVNAAPATYYWVAFRSSALELALGTYAGDNFDGRSIPVGFQPEYVITLPADAAPALHRSVTMTGDTSYDFDANELGPPANAIQAFELGGFQVGNSAAVNLTPVTYHYIAWNFMPSRTFMGTYLGDGFDPRPLDVVGFMPEWVLVKRQGDAGLWVHKPASTGVGADYSLYFANLVGIANAIQTLRPLGFEVGGDSSVNFAGATYHWIAFGPHPPSANHRSIGAAPDYGTGTVTVANGSTAVSGLGTSWKTANRGRGDVITIPCDDPPTCTGGANYTVASVSGEATLQLTEPAVALAVGASHLIRRQFATLTDWEDCIDGPPGTACAFFPVASDSLVADNRTEVGIAYKDGPFTGGLVIDGRLDNVNTDASHTITLTADPGNRHHGKVGTGVVIDNGASATPAVQVFDNFVTIEWIEVKGGGPGADAIKLDGLSAGPDANGVVLRSSLVHHAGGRGVLVQDPDTILDAHNNVVYRNTQRGVEIAPSPLSADSRIRLRSNTLFNNSAGGIAALDASNPTVKLENNIAHSNLGSDFSVQAVDPASRNNLASDGSAVPHSPAGGGVNSVPLAAVSFVSTVSGSEDLHIKTGSAAENAGADLGAFLNEDIDEETRHPTWEIGADDTGLGSGSCSLLTTSLGASTITVETPEVGMVWDPGPNGGGGLNELYGKTEPNALVSRSGDLAGYNVFSTHVNNGSWFFEGNGQPGSVQPLEATPLRVRLRQRVDYTGSIHLSRDWTAYAFPRLVLDETLTLDVAQGLRGSQGLQAKGEAACGGANTFFCAGNSNQAERVWVVSDDSAAYSDMLAFPYGSPFFARSAAGPSWEALFEPGAPNTFFSRVRENLWLATAAGSDRRPYLLYPYLAGLGSLGTGWRALVDDYRGPDVLTINGGAGSPWLDAAENTGAGDFFNEAENAYLLDAQPVLGLDFDMSGAVTRRKPFFKIRRWSSLQPPASVSLEGVPLAAGTDYRAALKPVARAHLCIPACNQLAMGGLVGNPSEYLNDPTPAKNAVLSLVGANFLYLGSDSRFRGLNVLLEVPGAGAATLQWQYWNGSAWTPLVAFTDTTSHLTRNGSISWTADPPGWSTTSVSGGPSLYYVRAFVSAGAYTTLPKEALIRTDILLFQYCGNITASAQTFDFAPLAAADLGVTKSSFPPTAVPGSPFNYTVTVTNNGPDTVTSLFVNDVVPAAIPSPGYAPSTGTYSSATGEWTGLSLAMGQSVTLTISGTIDPFARGSLFNTVTVSPPPGTTDSNGSNDFDSDTDALDASADVGIDKVDDATGSFPLGGLLTYTLTVTNHELSVGATSVEVFDTLPASMPLDAALGAITSSQGSCSYDGPSRTVDCTLGNLAPLGVATVTIKVRPGALGNLDNAASVIHGEPDPVSGNDSDGETTQVVLSTLGVQAFTATSKNQRNVLTWVNPSADYDTTEIRWSNVGFPTGVGDGIPLYNGSGGGAGGRFSIAHGTLTNGLTYYYAAFVHPMSGPPPSPGRFVSGRPFDHTPGPVKWAFSTGATALAAPTVGGAGVIATSNDHRLYAMQRGTDDDLTPPDSGEWPLGFMPADVGKPVQGRSPVVPVDVFGANPVVFVGSQDGKVYAIDATQGGAVPPLWVAPLVVQPAMVQAAPAGIFTDFGGALDYILIGTYDPNAANIFFALEADTGLQAGRYDTDDIGIVSGMAAVDYGAPTPPPAPRVYFTSYARGNPNTLWCFELEAPLPGRVFATCWAPRPLGNIASSPVLRGGRVYVGGPLVGGTVYSIDALTGGGDRTHNHNDGQVRGFIFPDRASNDIYFATDDFVWGLTDTGAATMAVKPGWPISLPGGARPSPVLFVPGSHYLYVGGSDGKLYEIDTLQATPVPIAVTLGNGLAVVGAPSLDREYNLIHVGTEAGIFYAVQVPLPPCIPFGACTTLNAGQACWVTSTTECSTKTCTGVATQCQ